MEMEREHFELMKKELSEGKHGVLENMASKEPFMKDYLPRLKEEFGVEGIVELVHAAIDGLWLPLGEKNWKHYNLKFGEAVQNLLKYEESLRKALKKGETEPVLITDEHMRRLEDLAVEGNTPEMREFAEDTLEAIGDWFFPPGLPRGRNRQDTKEAGP